MKRHVILSLIVCMTMAAGACAQDTGSPAGTADDAAAMGLKDAYAGKINGSVLRLTVS